jgi:hypothetical protein
MTLSRNFFRLATAFISMCVACAAGAVALSETGLENGPAVVSLVALGVALVCLWMEAKSDLDAVLTMVAVSMLLAAICVGIYLFSADHAGLAPKAALGGAILISAACGFMTYRRQHGSSADFPNVLLKQAPAKDILETEGVQFLGFLKPGGGGKPHALSVVLQNCFNAPRTVRIRLDGAAYASYMRFQPEHQVVLGPAEVARVVFPIVAPTYPGSYRLYLEIGVSGKEGKRVRLWRAREAPTRTSSTETVVLAALGTLKVGGGVFFTIGPLPDDLWNTHLAVVSFESLWQPRIGTVPLFQRV